MKKRGLFACLSEGLFLEVPLYLVVSVAVVYDAQ